jgi:hypothetical protein
MTFEQTHPDVVALPTYNQMRRYRQNSITGRVIEAWERDDDGVWHDVTLREQAIEQAQRELAAARREHRRVQEEANDEKTDETIQIG